MRPFLAAALSLLPLGALAQDGARIALADDFRVARHHYASVDRPDGITYRLYINDLAFDTWREERRLPSGTVFAIENFLAMTDGDGQQRRDATGRLIEGDSLNDVHVPMKSAAWAEDGPQTTTGLLRGAATGDGTWRMAGFDPRTGAPTPDLNIAECHSCHLDPRAEDFHLSRGLLDSFVRTGQPAFISFTCAEREICFGSARRLTEKSMRLLAFALILAPAPAAADPAALAAYVGSFEAEDPEACVATFAPGAQFIDLGNDFSDRLDWFCNSVVDGGGRYNILSQQTVSDRTIFTLEYQAGGYFLAGKGSLIGTDGKITSLVIEPR